MAIELENESRASGVIYSQRESALSSPSPSSPRTPSPVNGDGDTSCFPTENLAWTDSPERKPQTGLEWPELNAGDKKSLPSPCIANPNGQFDLTQYLKGQRLAKDSPPNDFEADAVDEIHCAKRMSIQRLSLCSSPPSPSEFELYSSEDSWSESDRRSQDSATEAEPPALPPKSRLRLLIPQKQGAALVRGPRIGLGPIAQRGHSPASLPRPANNHASYIPPQMVVNTNAAQDHSQPPELPQRSVLRDEHWLLGSKSGDLQFRTLQPFSRTAFVTLESFTSADFKKWLPLIKFALPGRWYTMPTVEAVESLYTRPGSSFLESVAYPSPDEEIIPQLRIGKALNWRSVLGFEEGRPSRDTCHEIASSPEARSPAGKCEEKSGATFYSILSSVQKWGPDPATDFATCSSDHVPAPKAREPDRGERIFQVLSHGSRNAAASEAYYYAGVKGWSTLFTVAVKTESDEHIGSSTWHRVEQLSDLGKGRGDVFY